MPVYEYECNACSHRFEEWQKINDKPVKVCPKCKARKVERLISHTSFQLKGGGWYGDLYASKKPGVSAGSGSSGSSAGGGGGSTEAKAKDSGSSSTTEAKATAAASTSTSTPKDGGKTGKVAAA